MTSPVALFVRRWGTGDRRVLLVHGLSSSSEGWWRLGPDLAASGWAVAAPDLRSHGESPPGDGLALDDYRDDLLALGTGWDLVVGHSLGGLVALACQLADPSFAGGLILEDPWLRVRSHPELNSWLLEEYAEPITLEGIASRRPRWSAEDVAGKLRALEAAGPHMVRDTVESLDSTDLGPELSSLAVPTLLMAADPELDALVTPDQGRAAAANPHISFVTIAGASHSIHRDSYPAFWDAVVSFAGDHIAAAGAAD